MNKVAYAALGALLFAPIASFSALPLLTVVEIFEIKAEPAAVWATLA